MYSTDEPGIGIFWIICVIQFIAGNIILYLLERQPKCNSCKKSNGKTIENLEKSSVIETVIKQKKIFLNQINL